MAMKRLGQACAHRGRAVERHVVTAREGLEYRVRQHPGAGAQLNHGEDLIGACGDQPAQCCQLLVACRHEYRAVVDETLRVSFGPSRLRPSRLGFWHRSPPVGRAHILRGGSAAMSDTSKSSAGARVTVTLEEAGPEAVPVLRRLMQLYLYDLGTIDGWNIGTDGYFGNPEKIERFWTERGRRSFFIRADGALAGFVLIRDEASYAGQGTHEISEFFVLRKFRRQGIGEQ